MDSLKVSTKSKQRSGTCPRSLKVQNSSEPRSGTCPRSLKFLSKPRNAVPVPMEPLICIMNCNRGRAHGSVIMSAVEGGVRFDVNLKLVFPGLHGFHVHRFGDLTRGCESLCGHYNPDGYNHGDLNQLYAHRGDLGNISSDQKGYIRVSLVSNRLSLEELKGRSLIVHRDEDDLGLGNFPYSKTTGHSGPRVLCGVIGYKEKDIS